MDTTETQDRKIYRPQIKSIIEQHVEEAAYCWLRLENALWHPAFNLLQLNRCNERLDAHLEGLRLAEDSVWPYALKRMNQWKTADEIFAASYIAIQACNEDYLHSIVRIVSSNSVAAAGITAALQWTLLLSGKEKTLPTIQFLWQQHDAMKSTIIDVALQIPEINTNAILSTSLNSPDVVLRTKALDAIGNYHLTDYQPVLYDALNNSAPPCRLAASTSLAIMGKPEQQRETAKLIPSLKGNDYFKQLLVWSSTSAEEDFNGWLNNTENNLSLRDLIWANAFRGDSRSLARLATFLDHKDAASLAAYAIQHITGLDLDSLDDNQKQPSDMLDDDEKNMSAPIKQLRRESEGLSSAPPDAIKEWLTNHWDSFNNGNQFLNGAPIKNSLPTVSASCSMPQHWHRSLIKTLAHQSLDWSNFPKHFFSL
ncbi:HEAT repeat domain-containing protein [Cellvibrio sp.]